jgi:hypothetical protein
MSSERRDDVVNDLASAALWALRHLATADQSNAAMHCAEVRFSPITFRLAEALHELGYESPDVLMVMSHKGKYEEDPGR